MPDFAVRGRDELSKWYLRDLVEGLMEGPMIWPGLLRLHGQHGEGTTRSQTPLLVTIWLEVPQ